MSRGGLVMAKFFRDLAWITLLIIALILIWLI